MQAEEPGSAFVPWRAGEDFNDYRCERHYVKAKGKVLSHLDDTLSVWHGPRRLARHQSDEQLIAAEAVPVAA